MRMSPIKVLGLLSAAPFEPFCTRLLDRSSYTVRSLLRAAVTRRFLLPTRDSSTDPADDRAVLNVIGMASLHSAATA